MGESYVITDQHPANAFEEYLRKAGTQELRIGIIRERRLSCAGSSEQGGSRASSNRETGFQIEGKAMRKTPTGAWATEDSNLKFFFRFPAFLRDL
jgi:hypothetical protein